MALSILRALPPLLALAACAAPGGEPRRAVEAAGDGPQAGVVTAALGRTARLGALSVRPLALLEDSRCPRDVACVWAGRLRLRAALVPGGEVELVLGEPHPLGGGGTLTLVAASPEPWQRPPPGTETGPATRFAFRRDGPAQ